MACPSENELLEFAEGLLEPARSQTIAGHLDGCTDCRAVLAAIGRNADSETQSSVSVQVASPPSELPADMLRADLREEAPHRERLASVAIMSLALVAIFLLSVVMPADIAAGGFRRFAIPVFVVVLIYELVIYWALSRGWFHRALPFCSTIIEISVFYAIMLIQNATMPPNRVLDSPADVALGAVIAFGAVRADPAIPLLGGLVAAIERVFVLIAMHEGWVGPARAGIRPSLIVVMTVFCLCAGGAGALLARYLVGRAEHALRAVREQDLFGKYLLHEPLGDGGMGQVFRATYCPEGGFTKVVAVKRLKAELASDEAFVRAFREEARLCSTLTHSNLVQVLDCGSYRGSFVLVMEYVDGATLTSILSAPEPLELSAVTYLGAEIAAALEYVHEKSAPDGAPLGLVHRDVNPPNILVSRFGDVKLGDFGVARMTGSEPSVATFAGKLSYAAPEQLAGGEIDGRADLFGLGVTLHEALVGLRKKGAATATVLEAPALQRPEIPIELDRLVSQLLEAEPGRRPANASEVRARLVALTGSAAPHPNGRAALARGVAAARIGHRAAPKSAAQRLATQIEKRVSLEPLTAAKSSRR